MVLSETCLVNIPLFSARGWSTCWYCPSATAASDTITWILPPLQHNPRLNSGIVPPVTKQLKESHCQVPRKLRKSLTAFNPLGSLEPATQHPLVPGTRREPTAPVFSVAIESCTWECHRWHRQKSREMVLQKQTVSFFSVWPGVTFSCKDLMGGLEM